MAGHNIDGGLGRHQGRHREPGALVGQRGAPGDRAAGVRLVNPDGVSLRETSGFAYRIEWTLRGPRRRITGSVMVFAAILSDERNGRAPRTP